MTAFISNVLYSYNVFNSVSYTVLANPEPELHTPKGAIIFYREGVEGTTSFQ